MDACEQATEILDRVHRPGDPGFRASGRKRPYVGGPWWEVSFSASPNELLGLRRGVAFTGTDQLGSCTTPDHQPIMCGWAIWTKIALTQASRREWDVPAARGQEDRT